MLVRFERLPRRRFPSELDRGDVTEMPVQVFVIEEFHRDTSVLTTWNCIGRIKVQFRLAGRTALNASGKLAPQAERRAGSMSASTVCGVFPCFARIPENRFRLHRRSILARNRCAPICVIPGPLPTLLSSKARALFILNPWRYEDPWISYCTVSELQALARSNTAVPLCRSKRISDDIEIAVNRVSESEPASRSDILAHADMESKRDVRMNDCAALTDVPGLFDRRPRRS